MLTILKNTKNVSCVFCASENRVDQSCCSMIHNFCKIIHLTIAELLVRPWRNSNTFNINMCQSHTGLLHARQFKLLPKDIDKGVIKICGKFKYTVENNDICHYWIPYDYNRRKNVINENNRLEILWFLKTLWLVRTIHNCFFSNCHSKLYCTPTPKLIFLRNMRSFSLGNTFIAQ